MTICQDSAGTTPLLAAAAVHNAELVAELLKGKASLEMRCSAGNAGMLRKCWKLPEKKEQLIKTLDSTDIQTDSARKIMGIDEMKISK